MTRVGVGQSTTGTGGTADTFFISYHGYIHTHMDTLCHFLYNGKMYNGYSEDEVTENGAAKNSILNFKNGIITRGILMDIPRLKGVDYLEPGTRIYPEDLDAWEKQAHLKVGPGDVVFIRTGRFARRAAKGPWPIKDGLAGLYITAPSGCMPAMWRSLAATPRRTSCPPAWKASPSRSTCWCWSPWGCRSSTIAIWKRSARKLPNASAGISW